uniref:Uncharacterized protein n=1 Tax=Oryza nivara TaxID=4536 RepID=A0A0E0ID58_ORYNI
MHRRFVFATLMRRLVGKLVLKNGGRGVVTTTVHQPTTENPVRLKSRSSLEKKKNEGINR